MSFDDASSCLVGTIIDAESACPLRVTEVLGCGSYATVFGCATWNTPHVTTAPPQSETLTRQQRLAVKVLFKAGLTDYQLSAQRDEALILQRLSGHHHIVKLDRVLDTPDHLFLVQERCDEDLFDVIQSGKLDAQGPFYDIVDEIEMVESIKDVFDQLADAVSFCHSSGVYHRDIKPENILTITDPVTCDISVKLSDFGLATTNAYPQDFGAGSMSYVCPESLSSGCFNQGSYDAAKADVWSLGIVLFNMLTTTTPWYKATMDDENYSSFAEWLQDGYLNGTPSPLALEFSLSPACDAIFARLFQPDPSRRMSLAELRQTVRSLQRVLCPKSMLAKIQLASATAPMNTSFSATNSATSMKRTSALPSPTKSVRSFKFGGATETFSTSGHNLDHHLVRSWSSDGSEMDFSMVPSFTPVNFSLSADNDVALSVDSQTATFAMACCNEGVTPPIQIVPSSPTLSSSRAPVVADAGAKKRGKGKGKSGRSVHDKVLKVLSGSTASSSPQVLSSSPNIVNTGQQKKMAVFKHVTSTLKFSGSSSSLLSSSSSTTSSSSSSSFRPSNNHSIGRARCAACGSRSSSSLVSAASSRLSSSVKSVDISLSPLGSSSSSSLVEGKYLTPLVASRPKQLLVPRKTKYSGTRAHLHPHPNATASPLNYQAKVASASNGNVGMNPVRLTTQPAIPNGKSGHALPPTSEVWSASIGVETRFKGKR